MSFSARTRALWISWFLLLICSQMFISLVMFRGVFIYCDKSAIGLLDFHPAHGDSELSFYHRSPVSGQRSAIAYIVQVMAMFFIAAVVLVPFALLSMLFAAYTKDRTTHHFSTACLAASSLLKMTSIIAFLLLYRSYVSWEQMTTGFYFCVGVQVQLVIVTVLTHVSGKKLTSDWI